MHITFVTFNFKGADAAAEEKHYCGYHVALAKSLPGVSLYLAGRLRSINGAAPDRFRAAVLGFASAEASGAAMATEAGAKVIADTQAHLDGLRLETFEAEAVVPFEKAPCGARRFVLAAAFNFRPEQGDLASAERRYRTHHVAIARGLPALKGYLIARLSGERRRMAMLMFEDFDAFRAAMRSTVGRELGKDGEATLAGIRADHIDARVEL